MVWVSLFAVYNFWMTVTGAPIDNRTSDLLEDLSREMQGQLDWTSLGRTLYATDASAYQETPLAVAFPETDRDLETLIRIANQHRIGLIPRTAGTSLAGQVVGSGIVVDVSRHWTQILEVNPDERWVRVQPGVIRDELNMALAEHGLMLGRRHRRPTERWSVGWWEIIAVDPTVWSTAVRVNIRSRRLVF